MAAHPSILLIEDSPGECELFRAAVKESGVAVSLQTESTIEEAFRFLAQADGVACASIVDPPRSQAWQTARSRFTAAPQERRADKASSRHRLYHVRRLCRPRRLLCRGGQRLSWRNPTPMKRSFISSRTCTIIGSGGIGPCRPWKFNADPRRPQKSLRRLRHLHDRARPRRRVVPEDARGYLSRRSSIPSILVTTFYRGLSPSEMEGAITLRMEQRFVEASYVEHIESQSLAGMSYIKVFFQPEYGIDAAQSELTSLAYSIIRLSRPASIRPRSTSSAWPVCRSGFSP